MTTPSCGPAHSVRSRRRRRIAKRRLISCVELDIAGLLAQTPYVLLMAIPASTSSRPVNSPVEAGPIAHYANPKRHHRPRGTVSQRYQSDEVDVNGRLVRCGNRRLRAALPPHCRQPADGQQLLPRPGRLVEANKVNPRLQRRQGGQALLATGLPHAGWSSNRASCLLPRSALHPRQAARLSSRTRRHPTRSSANISRRPPASFPIRRGREKPGRCATARRGSRRRASQNCNPSARF